MSKDYVYTGVEKALFLLSRGHCYEPNCQVPVLQVINGEPFVNVQIAHICAEEENGPRYDPLMTREARRSFSNLILLCKPHHTMIDRMVTVGDYPVSLLRGWKKSREGDFASHLNGIGVLNEERLQELMAGAVVEVRQNIEDAADVLTSVSRETADMVKSLALEAFDRPYVPALDLDAVASLERSAHRLASLPDYAPMLVKAAEKLGDLEMHSTNLRCAAQELESAYGGVPRTIQELGVAIDKLPRVSSDLVETVDKIEREAAELSESTPPVIHIDDQQRWQYFKVGAGLGSAAVFVAFLFTYWLIMGAG